MTALAQISEGRAGRSGQGDGAGLVPVAVSFTIPVPPSVNNIFRNLPGRGRVKTHDYNDWQAFALTHIRQQAVAPVSGRVVVTFGVERASNTADIDNRIKAMLDTIVEAGIIEDDKLVTAFAAAWLPHANGLAHIQILPVGRVELTFRPSPDGVSGGWFIATPQLSSGDYDGPEPR